MTIGTLTFYSMPGSLTTGEYPILTAGQDVSGYAVHTITNARFSRNLDTYLQVPYFDDYDTVNMISMAWTDVNDDEHTAWYWITSYHFDTHANESVGFDITYNPVMSLLTLGGTVSGAWKRTPDICRTQHDTAVSGDTVNLIATDTPGVLSVTAEGNQIYTLDFIETPKQYDYSDVFWVEIVSSNYYASYGATPDTDRISHYGMFVYYDRYNPTLSLRLPIYDPTGGTLTGYYPSLYDVINNIDSTLGIEASSVIGVYISEICPYVMRLIDTGSHETPFLYNGSVMQPTMNNATEGIYYYNLSVTNVIYPQKDWTEYTMPLERAVNGTDIRYPMCVISDRCGNVLGTIPTDNGAESVTFRYRTVCDAMGINTYIAPDNSPVIIIPHGRLPYVGDAWETYKAYQWANDQESLANTKAMAWGTMGLGIGTSLINTAQSAATAMAGNVSAVPSMVSGASSIAGSVGGMILTRVQAEMDATLTEHTYQRAMGTAYVMSGESYIWGTATETDNDQYHISVTASFPKGWTVSKESAYRSEYGYPSEDIGTRTLTAGRYQGRIYSDPNNISGPKLDRLNEVFGRGVKLIGL